MYVRISLPVFTNKTCWDIFLDFITFRSIWKEWTSVQNWLSIHEHELLLHLFALLYFLLITFFFIFLQSHTYFVRFIPGYLLFFDDCHRLGLSEADEKKFSVQAIYKGSIPVEGRKRKQNWTEKEVKLHCKPGKALVNPTRCGEQIQPITGISGAAEIVRPLYPGSNQSLGVDYPRKVYSCVR